MEKLILVWDLDETLIATTVNQQSQRKHLSISSDAVLSRSDDGIAIEPVMAESIEDGKTEQITVDEVVAYARHDIKKILDDIYHLKQKAEQHGLPSPVEVKVITNASYSEKPIKELFNQFYGDHKQDTKFTNGDFPIEYYNVENLNQIRDSLPKKQWRYETIDVDTTIEEKTDIQNSIKNRIDDLVNNKENNVILVYKDYGCDPQIIYDPRKALLMEQEFPKWKAANPELQKENVWLIDNSEGNISGVKARGFKGELIATCKPDQTYNATSFTQTFFKTLTSLTSELSNLDKALEQEIAKKNNPQQTIKPL